MKILVAMDSFKGSMTSADAAEAVKKGILSADPFAEVCICPLADGGEGTVDALLSIDEKAYAVGIWASDPLGKPHFCQYGVLGNGTAVIEVAETAGLTLIPKEKRDPMMTTTYGVGEMIRDAINRGHRDFMIGLGGSGTNDGGLGMLRALGWMFQDRNGEPIPHGAIGLKDLAVIDGSNVMPELSQCRFTVICDVANPLTGELGCSAVFGPQKGAGPEGILAMDQWMRAYGQLVQRHFPTADPNAAGMGAAGGLGFAVSAFLGGKIESGAELIGRYHSMEEKIASCDLIITGEGSFDGQTAMGKGPMYIARLGKVRRKPVIVLAGSLGDGIENGTLEEITACFSILPRPMTLAEAMDPANARKNLTQTVSGIMRLIQNI